jgi:hypothetical protein
MRSRMAFLLDLSGQPDFAAMAKTLFQKGGLEQGVAASNLDISRQQLKNGQALSEKLGQIEGGGQPPPIVSPPSANRGASVPVAPPLNRGGAQPAGQPQASGRSLGGGTTLGQILTAQGIPNDQLGPAGASIARQLGLEDPNATDRRERPENPQRACAGHPAVEADGHRAGRAAAAPDRTGRSPAAAAAPADGQQPNPSRTRARSAPRPRSQRAARSRPGLILKSRSRLHLYLDCEQPGLSEVGSGSRQDAPRGHPKADGASRLPKRTTTFLAGRAAPETFDEWQAKNEQRKTAATEEAKLGAKKYEGLVEAGTKAQMEIPQLDLLKEQMNDPNFFSGAGRSITCSTSASRARSASIPRLPFLRNISARRPRPTCFRRSVRSRASVRSASLKSTWRARLRRLPTTPSRQQAPGRDFEAHASAQCRHCRDGAELQGAERHA